MQAFQTHFMFSGRCRSSFKISRIYQTNRPGFPRPIFSNKFKLLDFRTCEIPQNKYFPHFMWYVHVFREVSWCPKIKCNWFWKSWSRSLGPKTMKIIGVSSSPKMNPKSYQSKMEQNNLQVTASAADPFNLDTRWLAGWLAGWLGWLFMDFHRF